MLFSVKAMLLSFKIRHRLGLLFVFIMVTAGVSAQAGYGARNFDSLARNPVEYRRILDKFTAGTVRPSVEECTLAYYGFPLQESYTGSVEGEERLIGAVMEEHFLPAYLTGKRILENDPVSLTALYYTLLAATQIDEPWEVRNSLKARYNSIAFVISRSGDGSSPETAFKTIYLGDIYTFAATELGLEIGEAYLLDDRWMALEVTPSEKFNHDIVYFDTLVDVGNGISDGGNNQNYEIEE